MVFSKQIRGAPAGVGTLMVMKTPVPVLKSNMHYTSYIIARFDAIAYAILSRRDVSIEI